MPFEVVVEGQGVAGVSDIADHGAGPDVPEMSEAAEMRVSDETLRADQTDGKAGEPVVDVRHGQTGERRADRPAGRRVDVVALVRVEPSRGSRLTEVILIRDGTLHGTHRERAPRHRVIRAGARVGGEPPRPDDTARRRDGVAVYHADPPHPGRPLLVHPRVRAVVTTYRPSSDA